MKAGGDWGDGGAGAAVASGGQNGPTFGIGIDAISTSSAAVVPHRFRSSEPSGGEVVALAGARWHGGSSSSSRCALDGWCGQSHGTSGPW